VCLYFLFTTWLSVGWVGRARRTENRFDDAQATQANDALLNCEQVRLLAAQKRVLRRFGRFWGALQRGQQSSDVAATVLATGQQAITACGLGVALMLVARRVCSGTASVGDLPMVQGLVSQLWAPLQFLGFYIRQARQALVDLEDARMLLNRPSSELEAAEALERRQLGSEFSAEALSNLPQAAPGCPLVEFRDVWFRYESHLPWILQGLSFCIEPGQFMAIVGPSGSGKSSLGRLVPRLFDTCKGSVLFNGVDVRHLQLSELRGRLAVVPQDVVVFNSSLLQNLTFARPGASKEEVEAAVRKSGLASALLSGEEGGLSLQSVVGERGLRLSGGERQRLSFARALLRAPQTELLLLDEATSALDSETGQLLLESLAELRSREGGSPPAILAITHQLKMAQQADKILVVEQGRITESGTHEELLDRQGAYAALLQAEGFQASAERAESDE
ncbi:ABCB25, partial [Symbiodinium microadriaticum]